MEQSVREDLKFSIMVIGEQSVMIALATLKLQLPVVSLDFLHPSHIVEQVVIQLEVELEK